MMTKWLLENTMKLRRTTITNLVMVLAAAVSAIILFDGRISLIDLPLTFFIIFLGLVGAVFTAKHFERAEMHMRKG